MRKIIGLCLVLLTGALAIQASLADKISQDPNTPSAASASAGTSQPASDKRLAQNVTYESGYARLHAAADDLTRITGVTIRAGSSNKDWQIRDIPLVICVKDLPLGKLLSAIAESTHTLLSSQTMDNGERVYRLYRSKRLQDEIDGKLKAAQQKQYEQIDWAWDGMLKLAKSPEAQAELATMGSVNVLGSERLIAPANLLASLGPDAKDRVLSGEEINIDFKNSARASLAEQICTAHYKFMYWMSAQMTARKPEDRQVEKPKPEELAAAGINIKLREGSASGNTDVCISSPDALNTGHFRTQYSFTLSMSSGMLEKLQSLHLPPRPKGEQIEDSDHPSDPRMLPLATDQDWALPPFDAKVKMEKPEGKTCLTFADMIMALRKASGLNIVSEDFVSQNNWSPDEFGKYFGSETILSALLKERNGSWFYNANDKLLLGWTGQQGRWRMRHRNLVPESLLLSLTSKLDTGVELDDTTPILRLTEEQRNEWIGQNRDTRWLMIAFRNDKPLWQLYDALSASDKALSKTESGLPLAKLDSAQTIAFLQEKIAQEKASARAPSDSTEKITAAALQELLDPEILRTAVLRLKIGRSSAISTGDNVPNGPIVWDSRLHHSYVMEIDYEKDGQKATISTSDLGLSLPVYSSKREKELISKLKPSSGG